MTPMQNLVGLLLCAACGLSSACQSEPSSKPSPQLGSDTNWLASCASDGDCPQGRCRCGVCSLPCTEADDCAALAPARVCLEAGDLTETSCRLGFSEPAGGGVCSHGCSADTDCGSQGGSATRCIGGVCLPAAAVTPQGPVATLASDTSEAGGGGQPAAGSSGATAEPGDAEGAADAAAPIDAGAPAERPLSGTLDTTTGPLPYERPNPRPTCPCQSDWPADRAPATPGEAEANAYGGPVQPFDPVNGPFGGGVTQQCNPLLMEFPWYFTTEDPCLLYSACDLPCETDSDCPDGGSGSATPRCSTTARCYLDCDGLSCPDGMACVSGVDGAACYWPQDSVAPECAGFCRQNPPPRECDNWCAALLVACNPDLGVECCQGLTCTEEGLCDVPE